MVSHTQLQYYSHNYALVFMTGLLGCRWHRYKQSTKGSKKRDVVWYTFVLLVTLFTIAWFYTILISKGGSFGINELIYRSVRKWIDWYAFILAGVCVFFSYLLILMLLSLCHIVQGHQLYIHPIHLVLTALILMALIVLSVFLFDFNSTQAAILYFSLQMYGPFLQIGAVCLLTAMTWLISHQWFMISHSAWKVVCLGLYVFVMAGLYVAPLFVYSPCVVLEENLPSRPKLSAHRGASHIAPENTVISFDIASRHNAYAFKTDVRISYDGQAFLLYDEDLRLTTNVEQAFPDRESLPASSFNITDLRALDAGSWFLETDPWHTVGDLPSEQKAMYRNQTVPTLLELLLQASSAGTHVLMDIYTPPTHHPYHNATIKTITDTITVSGINQSKVFWLASSQPGFAQSHFTLLSPELRSVGYLKQNNITGVHIENSVQAIGKLKEYRSHGLFTSVQLVNSEWLYSYYWCHGVDMVTSDMCDVLSQLEKPLWHMAPRTYRAVWLSVDIVSFVLVIIMFVIQRSKVNGNKYKPEQVSLSTNSDSTPWGHKRTRRSMKEKLLMKDVQAEMFDFEPDESLGIESSSYDATVSVSEGRALSRAFHSNRASYHSNIMESSDGYPSNRQSVISYEENGISNYGDSYDGNRNSYHSNGSTYQTEAEIT